MRKTVVIDPMHGSGSGYLEDFLKNSALNIISIRSNRDPLFGGVNPEPIESNLANLIEMVKNNKADIGIAFDGDADRIGLVDKKGRFINSHHIMALLTLHLVRNKKIKGRVVKTISGSFLIDRICKKSGLELVETPIGFKYISEEMLKGGVMIGGEESGGIAVKGHLEERDGVMAALLILEQMAFMNKSLDELVDDLHEEFGSSCYSRKDIRINSAMEPVEFCETVKKLYKKYIKQNIICIKDYDGVKFITEDDSWFLIRPSGTEPVLRVYAEGTNSKKLEELFESAKTIAGRLYNS